MDSDSQRGYQKNMLYGNLIVTGLAAIFAVCLNFQSSDRVTAPVTPRTLADFAQREQVREEGKGRSGRNQSAPGLHGGFVTDLVIIPDVPVATTQFTVPAHVAFGADLTPVELDSDLALGEDVGSGYGPDDGDYGLPKAPVAYAELSTRSGEWVVPERTIVPPKIDEVAVISGFADPIPPRKARGVRGSVKVQFTITEQGRLQDIVVLEEAPQGLGLSQALIQRLNDCSVFPAVKGGAEVPTTITFTYAYGSLGGQALSTTGDVSLIMR